MGTSGVSAALAPLTLARRVIYFLFWLVILDFLLLFGLQFINSPKLDSLWLIVEARRWGSPVVRSLAGRLGFASGSIYFKALPLGLAMVTSLIQVGVNSLLLRVHITLFSAVAPRPKYVPPPPPPPPQPAAVPEPPPPLPSPPPTRTVAPRPATVAPVATRPPEPPLPPQPEPQSVLATAGISASAFGVGGGRVLSVEAAVGQRIGRYEIQQELGRGAMGAVFKALDPQLGRTVAIKVILTANLSPTALEDYKKRFFREARAAGQMSHPGIVTIHDVGDDQASGQPYLVMEFIEGSTLEDLMEEADRPVPLENALDIGLQVAGALDYAHRRGVVHRDIKPANILVTTEGVAKIADFGIAKLEGAQLTQTGQMVGTPAFMSPEQFTGGAVDGRSDIFSLGSLLYSLLTRARPFPGNNITEIIFKVVQTAPVPARQLNPSLSADVETVLSRCLAKMPDQRYPTAQALAADLETLKAGRPLVAPTASSG